MPWKERVFARTFADYWDAKLATNYGQLVGKRSTQIASPFGSSKKWL
jgi:hypothetical protein